MEKYRAPSREMIVALETIGQAQKIEERKKATEKSKVNLKKEDDLFNRGKLSFPEGTVIAVSSSAAKNVIWTDREQIFWA